jgi:hypothetical protein
MGDTTDIAWTERTCTAEYVDIGSETRIGIRWTWAVVAPGVLHRGKLGPGDL